jgi:hypothetical protein
MADIDVVPKQRSNTWVWILIAIAVIAVLVWAFVARTPATTQVIPMAAPAAIASMDIAPVLNAV